MFKEPKIIIIRGNSGSGKSTIAKKLQAKFGQGTMLIPQDIVRREILFVKDGTNTKGLSLLLNLIDYGRQNCDIIILEGILRSVWYKELFDKINENFKENIFAYYFDLPFEETLARHKQRPICNEFGEDEMRSWWNDKDYLEEIDEKHLTKEMGMEEIVDSIFDEVANS